MSAFSPGPWTWKACRVGDAEGTELLDSAGTRIIEAWSDVGEGAHDGVLTVYVADARLIAAAREMYELVKLYAYGDGDVVLASRALLARIDGKEPE